MDIELLRFVWWLLIGFILIGFAVLDGFDFGAAILSPFVAKTELQKRVVLNTIGPFWEGNQVWLVLGAGGIFAAWPFVYSVAFSGFYLLILILLLTMGISRPVSFKYRSKVKNPIWRKSWDMLVFIGGLVPALIFGILIGNILLGIPFYFDDTMRSFYTGSFFDLFRPFTLLCGLTSLFMIIMHGGLYLATKTDNPIRSRAIAWAQCSAILFIIMFAACGYLLTKINGYVVTSGGDPFGVSNPLHKQVVMQVGAWFNNYYRYPHSMAAPIIGFAGACLAILFARIGTSRFAFMASGLSIIGVIASIGISMFPFILPSSIQPRSSLLVWDSSSTQLTLILMLIVVLIFMPIILFYTAWVYNALRGRVTEEMIKRDERTSY